MTLSFVELGDVADVSWGNTSITKASYVDTGYSAFSAAGCDGFLPDFEHDTVGVVLSAIGARCGRCFLAKGKWTAIKNTITITPHNTRKADFRFLYYYLNTEGIWPRRGGGQPFIGLADARKIPVPDLAVPEQRRIADILDRADALRAKRRAAIAHLDELTQAIFIDMFGDPVSNPNEWPIHTLYSLAREDDSINYGVVQPGDDQDDGVALIRVGDIQNGRVNHSSLKKISPVIEANYKRSRLRGDEVLLSCVGSVGEVALARDSERGFNIARAVARIPLKADVDRVFIASFLRSDCAQRYFKNELRTVSQPTLNIKQIGETAVPLPPAHLQREYAKKFQLVEEIRGKEDTAACHVDDLFASLQDRAFRGAL